MVEDLEWVKSWSDSRRCCQILRVKRWGGNRTRECLEKPEQPKRQASASPRALSLPQVSRRGLAVAPWPESGDCVSGRAGHRRPGCSDERRRPRDELVGQLRQRSPRLRAHQSAGCLPSAAAMLPAATVRTGGSRQRASSGPAPPGGCSRVRAAGGGRPAGSGARWRPSALPFGDSCAADAGAPRGPGTGAAPSVCPSEAGVFEGQSGRDEVRALCVRTTWTANFGVLRTFQSTWDRGLQFLQSPWDGF